MKYVRFSRNGESRYGILDGNKIAVLNGDLFGEHEESGEVVDLDAVKHENAPVRVFKMKSKPDGDPFTLGERYGCITSYENQTCAAPGYNESEIHCVLSHVKDDLAEKMIVRLGDQPSGGL